jgi:hypothetical protein
MSFDEILFGKKSFSDILKEIYENSKKKEQKINALIDELKGLINNIGDATVAVPLLVQYLEVGVKNDEHLIKMAAIAQKVISATKGGSDTEQSFLSEEDKKQLLAEIEAIEKDINKKEQLN